MDRMVKIVLGDWSDDGHGKTETIIVRLSGKDVTDSMLSRAVQKAESDTGVSLKNILANYQDSTISQANFNKLLRVFGSQLTDYDEEGEENFYPAFTAEVGERDEWEYSYQIGDNTYLELSVLRLLTLFLGYNIEGFEYEVVEIPTVVGTYNAVVPSFGYGLFI